MLTRVSLSEMFDDFNLEFFNGRLPTYTVRRAAHLGRLHMADGLCDPIQRQIHVQSGLRPSVERQVLLHEMCHAAIPGHAGHGAPFREQLRRLARKGELWALEEVKAYSPGSWLSIIDSLETLDVRWKCAAPNTRERIGILKTAERLLAELEQSH